MWAKSGISIGGIEIGERIEGTWRAGVMMQYEYTGFERYIESLAELDEYYFDLTTHFMAR